MVHQIAENVLQNYVKVYIKLNVRKCDKNIDVCSFLALHLGDALRTRKRSVVVLGKEPIRRMRTSSSHVTLDVFLFSMTNAQIAYSPDRSCQESHKAYCTRLFRSGQV
jgi:uncharacterized membrane protein